MHLVGSQQENSLHRCFRDAIKAIAYPFNDITSLKPLHDDIGEGLWQWATWTLEAVSYGAHLESESKRRKFERLVRFGCDVGLRTVSAIVTGQRLPLRSVDNLLYWASLIEQLLRHTTPSKEARVLTALGWTDAEYIGSHAGTTTFYYGRFFLDFDDVVLGVRDCRTEALLQLDAFVDPPIYPYAKCHDNWGLSDGPGIANAICHAWRELRIIARNVNISYPPEPISLETIRQRLNALDILMSWCIEHREDTSQNPRESFHPRCRLKVDVEKQIVFLDDKPHQIESELAVRWLAILIAHPGEYIPGTSLGEFDSELIGMNHAHKLKKNYLPPEIADLISGKTGAGHRLTLDAFSRRNAP